MRWAPALLVLALGCLTINASSAGAAGKSRPAATKLLPKRSCQGLLSINDFPGSVREFAGKGVSSSTGYSTDCIYFPPESSESDPEPEGDGVDYLTVTTRLGYEYKGKPLNLIEGPLQKRAEKMGETVIHLHGIGTRAEIVVPCRPRALADRQVTLRADRPRREVRGRAGMTRRNAAVSV
jgi:hypothetical protein